MTTRQTPYIELALAPYGSPEAVWGVSALTRDHFIGDVVLSEGASAADRTSLVPDASRLQATIYDPGRAPVLRPRLAPGATVELRVNGIVRMRGELVSVDRDDVGRVYCAWESPLRRLAASRGPDIPAGADSRTPRQMLDAIIAAAGLPAATGSGQGQAGRLQRIAVPRGRPGLLQISDFGACEVLDETWLRAGYRVRLRPLSSPPGTGSGRTTDVPAYALRDSGAVLVPPAREHVDPWGVINHATVDLTVTASQKDEITLGAGRSEISLDSLSLGEHTHEITDSLGARGTTSDGEPVSVTISGTVTAAAAEVEGSPADVLIPEITLRLATPVLEDRTIEIHSTPQTASVARYGLRSRDRKLQMAITITAQTWADIDQLAVWPDDTTAAAYRAIADGALQLEAQPVYELAHDTTQGSSATDRLRTRRVGQRERLYLLADPGLHTYRVCALETTFRRDGWASQRAWYVRA